MKRLLKIEWFKLQHYRPFWILMGMYSLMTLVFCGGGMFFLQWLKSKGAEFRGFDPTILPIYDFPDVWQNMTFIASFLKIVLAFIVINSVHNELNHRIVRQNVIDGLDKKDWLLSKLLSNAMIALYAVGIVFVVSFFMGMIYSHADMKAEFYVNIHYLLFYFLDVFIYLCFALMLILIFKKGVLVIIGLLMYTLAFEPVACIIISELPPFPDHLRFISEILPVAALRGLLPFPFQKYVLFEAQDAIPVYKVAIALAWLVINVAVSYWMLKRKDL